MGFNNERAHCVIGFISKMSNFTVHWIEFNVISTVIASFGVLSNIVILLVYIMNKTMHFKGAILVCILALTDMTIDIIFLGE